MRPGDRSVGNMKLSSTAHTSQRWRIHDVTPDFRFEDVWALPTPGAPVDFPWLMKLAMTDDPRALDVKGRYVGNPTTTARRIGRTEHPGRLDAACVL